VGHPSIGLPSLGDKMERIARFIIIVMTLSLSCYAQDSIDVKLQQEVIAIGMDLTGVTSGPHFMYYNNSWLITATYGLPKSDISQGVIKEYKGTILIRGAYAIGCFHGTDIFWPIYVGVAMTYVFEKNTVVGLHGNGSIAGLSSYIGLRMFEHNTKFLSGIGAFLELGYTEWNYNNSVLRKNKSSLNYGYPAFYFSFGVLIFL
jgi:hypothetical protein